MAQQATLMKGGARRTVVKPLPSASTLHVLCVSYKLNTQSIAESDMPESVLGPKHQQGLHCTVPARQCGTSSACHTSWPGLND